MEDVTCIAIQLSVTQPIREVYHMSPRAVPSRHRGRRINDSFMIHSYIHSFIHSFDRTIRRGRSKWEGS